MFGNHWNINFLLFLGGIWAMQGCTKKPEVQAFEEYRTWQSYLGDPTRSHFSSLDQINQENVKNLEVAWTYHAGDMSPENQSQIQCNPIIVDTLLYATNPKLKLFALHAGNGREVWTFIPDSLEEAGMGVNRGVTYWEEGEDKRILFSAGSYLYALDARSGKRIPGFGKNGKVDLREGLGRDPEKLSVVATTPGAVYQNLLIQGSRVLESPGAAPGHVRAYDIKTGKLVWTFHTIPQPGEFGYDTWPSDAHAYIGGANSWAGISLDEEAGIAYVPTGSAAFDFYGGNRPGQNLFANCLLALDAATGKRLWHFQAVHHDIWDRDLPCPPNLVTVTHEGKEIPAVAQVTKAGLLFLFNRLTGDTLFPIEERSFPASTLEGEQAWPTQPIPTLPPPFARQKLTTDALNDMFPEAKAFVKEFSVEDSEDPYQSLPEQLAQVKSEGQFIPPSEQGNVMFPGFDGGAEWGGAAVDPSTGMLYVNASEMPWIFRMRKLEEEGVETLASLGKNLYQQQCARCHQADLKGQSGVYPPLLNLQQTKSEAEVVQILNQGKGAMPPFAHLEEEEKEALVAYLLNTKEKNRQVSTKASKAEVPYAVSSFGRFLDENGYPAVKPPWGTLSAIDLNQGEIAWQVPLGEFEELTAQGFPVTGTENYGGPIVTAGGLIFIGATQDEKFRAFNKHTGEILWETALPAGGYATPSTYEIKGKQYVVIACGGGKMDTKSGDAYVAFALPEAE